MTVLKRLSFRRMTEDCWNGSSIGAHRRHYFATSVSVVTKKPKNRHSQGRRWGPRAFFARIWTFM